MCFKIFQNKCIEIYEFDPTHFLSEPVLAMQACLKKKTEIELELFTDADVINSRKRNYRRNMSCNT